MSKLSKFRNTEGNKYLLIGAPNVGKSTIFNLLTTSTAIVSNIDRMTTDHTIGRIKHSKENFLVDLPGTYNLSHPISEEKETHYHLIHHEVSAIVNVISSFSIERDLYLTIQCIETGMLNTLCVNMIDLVNEKSLNWKKLGKKLNGLKIVLTRGNRNKNTKDLLHSIYKSKRVNPDIVKYSKEIESWISKFEKVLPDMNVSKRFAALMLLENNSYFIGQLKQHHPAYFPAVSKLLDETKNNHYIEEIRDTKIAFIKNLLKECQYDQQHYLKVNLSKQNRFDHYFLKKWIGIPIFLLIAVAIYYLAFGSWAGGWLQFNFNQALTNPEWGLAHWMHIAFDIPGHLWFASMLIDGIFAGLFTVLSFIPSITILYICVTIIQQIGLLSRVSILLDNALSKFGISGRSVVNLLTAFGCNVPGLMLARSSSSKKERIISVLIIPFIPCATKIIVISAIANAIFTLTFGWIFIVVAVLLSAFIALTLGFVFSKTLFRKQKSFFCVEMVNWNGIDFRIMFKNVWQTIKGFLKKALLTITVANLIFWALLHLGNVPGVYIDASTDPALLEQSALAYVAKGLSYILYPVLGSANWKLTSSLIAAIPAKELTLTTLRMIAGSADISSLFTSKALAASFMVFVLYYVPCIPSIATMKSEVGRKHMFLNIGVSLATAYVLGTLVYWIGTGISMVA